MLQGYVGFTSPKRFGDFIGFHKWTQQRNPISRLTCRCVALLKHRYICIWHIYPLHLHLSHWNIDIRWEESCCFSSDRVTGWPWICDNICLEGKYLEELAKTESTIAKVPTKSLPSEIVCVASQVLVKVLGRCQYAATKMLLRNGGSGWVNDMIYFLRYVE